MAFEPASSVLDDITVLDLTRVRAGPTCVRQLADWGARRHQDRNAGRQARKGSSAARAPAPISRTCTATSARMTLNLKTDEGVKIFKELVEERRRRRRELPPRCQASPRHRLRKPRRRSTRA